MAIPGVNLKLSFRKRCVRAIKMPTRPFSLCSGKHLPTARSHILTNSIPMPTVPSLPRRPSFEQMRQQLAHTERELSLAYRQGHRLRQERDAARRALDDVIDKLHDVQDAFHTVDPMHQGQPEHLGQSPPLRLPCLIIFNPAPDVAHHSMPPVTLSSRHRDRESYCLALWTAYPHHAPAGVAGLDNTITLHLVRGWLFAIQTGPDEGDEGDGNFEIHWLELLEQIFSNPGLFSRIERAVTPPRPRNVLGFPHPYPGDYLNLTQHQLVDHLIRCGIDDDLIVGLEEIFLVRRGIPLS